MNAGHFTKLDEVTPFPGTVTKLHAAATQVKAGDIVQVEWAVGPAFQGDHVSGHVKVIEDEMRTGPMGPERIFKLTFSEGWYTYGYDTVLVAGPEGCSPETDDVYLSGTPTTSRADFERTFELGTQDQPGWNVYVCGADTAERLRELGQMSGRALDGA
ncbi:hypothetical protein AB0F25_30380 [Streptomyces wedmorensis]|uniref:hypothetical protein n=1 Tax=Streptomyces wedmorensis TaxID=43759 RepID=UPI0034155D49